MKVLYREYRPDTFEDVIGQDVVISALSRAIESGRIAHAYLFSGPRGCGKTSCARIFARCLNCEKGPTATPCGKCPSCVDLANGAQGSIDVIEMDAASHGGVNDARDLRERIEFAPSRDRFKIVILDEAHMITNDAFNALLKVVEEPPEHVKFIFATTEPEKVIKTILSRTYHYSFNLVPHNIMVPFLKDIVQKEKVSIDERVYPLLVRVGGGSVRDTLSFLDQLISSAKDGAVEYDFAVKLFGFAPTSLIHESLTALQTNNFAALFDICEQVIFNGISVKGYIQDLLATIRDAILVNLTDSNSVDAHSLRTALGERSESELKQLSEFAASKTADVLTKYAEILFAGLEGLRGATSERLQLEIVVAKLAATDPTPAPAPVTPHATPTPEPVTASAASTSAPVTAPKTATPAPVTVTAPAPSTPAPAPVSASAPSAQIDDAVWDNVMSERKAAVMMAKTNATLVGIVDSVLQLNFANPRLAETFNNKGYGAEISTLIAKHGGPKVAVSAISDSTAAKSAAQEPPPEPVAVEEPETTEEPVVEISEDDEVVDSAASILDNFNSIIPGVQRINE